MAYPDINAINKNIYGNSTPLKKYSKELQRRQNLANWGQLRDAYQAANWTRQYDAQQMRQNAYDNAYNTGNTRGSYVNQAITNGMEPINQNYDQAMKAVGSQETALNDAAWAKAHAPKSKKPTAPTLQTSAQIADKAMPAIQASYKAIKGYYPMDSYIRDQLAAAEQRGDAANMKALDDYNKKLAKHYR